MSLFSIETWWKVFHIMISWHSDISFDTQINISRHFCQIPYFKCLRYKNIFQSACQKKNTKPYTTKVPLTSAFFAKSGQKKIGLSFAYSKISWTALGFYFYQNMFCPILWQDYVKVGHPIINKLVAPLGMPSK